MSTSAGERGPQGDHGQAGDTGPMGPSGFSRRKTMTLFLFTVLCFSLLAVRSEIQAQNINRNAHLIFQNQYDQCQQRNVNLERAATLYQGLIDIEKHNPFAKQGPAAAMTVQRRIDLYTANTPDTINCGPRP